MINIYIHGYIYIYYFVILVFVSENDHFLLTPLVSESASIFTFPASGNSNSGTEKTLSRGFIIIIVVVVFYFFFFLYVEERRRRRFRNSMLLRRKRMLP
jgi:hypothetical protein